MKFSCVAICLFFALFESLHAAERAAWTSSRIIGSPDPPKEYHVQRVYENLEFDQPVELMPLADTGKMMLLEVTGKLYTFDDRPDCATADLVIDFSTLSDNFRRALGFAVHPNFAKNRQVFLVYAGDPVARVDGTRLSRFVVSGDDPPRIDPASEEILLTWPSGGHNGCALRFDSDGLLYFSLGDGARPFPPDEYDVGQDLSDLRSTICRIDVDRRDGDLPYAIPKDNPFINTRLANGKAARPEIWAYGFRNPWRFTIVPETNQLLCGDVGWELWELVFDVQRGGNYGWSLFEGPQPIRSDLPVGPTPVRKPLVSYPHSVGQSVTGGVVYRGRQHPQLQGAFLYGDYVTGLLWGLRHDGDQVTWNPILAETGLPIISFAESRDNEVLVLSHAGGVYKLVKNKAERTPSEFPRKLSETGLFTSTRSLHPADGVIPYNIATSAWQDGATSELVVGIPGSETIQIERQQRRWMYPAGTVFAKTISVQTAENESPDSRSRRVETQLLHFDGINWQPYSYAWNQDQTDAELVDEAGLTMTVDSDGGRSAQQATEWLIHNRAQCRSCHSPQAGGAIGFTLANLDVPLEADPSRSQLDHLIQLGILDRPAPKQWNLTSMVDPADTTAGLEQRARSYLTANCAHCHRRGGGGTVGMDLTFSLPTNEINAVGVAATQGTFGLHEAKVIHPGDPTRSVLFYRMATSGTGHMPKLWTRDNDLLGLRLVHDWISSMPKDDIAAGKIDRSSPEGQSEDTAKALKLFSRLLHGNPSDGSAPSVAKLAASSSNVMTAALFERFLPQDQRRKRLGANIDPNQILAIQGDAWRGRERFMDAQAGQCIQCHRLQGSGRIVGADLDGVGKKRTRKQLLESILDPSKEIEPPFISYAVLTDDGNLITGLMVDESEGALVIRQANGKDLTIPKDEIESLKTQTQSLMPTGLAAEMTAQELADLLAFLHSLN